MPSWRIVLVSLVLASVLSGCIIVARPYHPFHCGPTRYYGCWQQACPPAVEFRPPGRR